MGRVWGTARRVLSLPMFPSLSDSQIDYVADSIRTYFDRNG